MSRGAAARLAGGTAAALLLVACAGPEARALRVSAAVSLAPAIREAFDAFEAGTGVSLELNTGGSGVLAQQVRRGAPADLLISAALADVDRLVDEGLALGATRRPLASNRLVIVVPCGMPPPDRLGGLVEPRFERIAAGNPATSPLGRYTRQALAQSGLWERLEPRLVLAEHARQTLDYVARGEVEAGVVYRTDSGLLGDRVCPGPGIDDALHAPIAYEGVLIAGANDAGDARAFLEWLSEEGPAVFERHGFAAPVE